MFLCRTGRLCAARTGAAATAFLAPTSNANGRRDATLTLHNNYTFQGHRCLVLSAGGVDPTRPWKRTVRHRDAPAFVAPERPRWDRASAAAARSLPQPAPSASYSDVLRLPALRVERRHSSAAEPFGSVLFAGSWRLPGPRGGAAWSPQTRASSTKTGQEPAAADKESLMEASAKTPEEPEEAKLSKTQQLKKVFKEYGAVGVSFHICISLVSLGMFYLLVSSGIDMAAVLCKLGFSEAMVRSRMAAGTSTFVLAYAIHKLFAPARISITLVSVPLIVRYFRKTGLFKPPTAAP
ncbi:unnamed protein product [Tetraodon nigroviridis]|nr:unnamed protein product [Tetraodon nigroviridis]